MRLGNRFVSICLMILGASCTLPVAFGQFTISTVAGGGPNNLPALQSGIGYAASVARDAAGNTYIADSYSSQVFEVSTAGTLTVIAGNGTLGYSGDGGPASSAALNRPEGVALDSAGNIYIADTDNSVIRVVNPGTQPVTVAGMSIAAGNIQTVAGNGTAGYGGDGGSATNAELNDPFGVFVDSQGDIFIADTDNSAIREVAASTGNIQTVAGTPGTTGYAGDGASATSALLDLPQGVTVDVAGNIYIADTFNSLIRAVNTGTQPVTVAGVAIPAGDIQTVAGVYYNSSLGNPCVFTGDNGPATSAYLCQPGGVFVDVSLNIFIADTENFGIREVVPSGTISTVAGTLGTAGDSGDGSAATSAQLNYPSGVFVDGPGNVLIADTDNLAIRQVTTGNISTIAGNNTLAYSGNGVAATDGALNIPDGVFVDASGNLFIADAQNSVIREVVAATGLIQTVAGNGIPCAASTNACGDGGPATSAQLNSPSGVFVDASGNIFIADTSDSRIREVVASTGVIQTVAGTGASCLSFSACGDGGPALSAELNNPYAVFVDGSGNIYVADTDDSAIRVVNPGTTAVTIAGVMIAGGSIATIAGNGTACTDPNSGCGDGGSATGAELNFPSGLSLDSVGNIYVADTFDNAVRQISAASGTIQTVAGTLGQRGYAGDNGAATSSLLDTPYGVFLDSFGNIFVADTDNSVVREVVAVNNNTIQTIAGNGTSGFAGDGGSSANAEFAHPLGVAGGSSGSLFIADSENSRIRQLVSNVNLALAPSVATVPLGDTQQLAATVTGAANASVTWQVNNVTGGNSTVGTISAGGLYQAPSSTTSSAVTVSAISNANGFTSASLMLSLAGAGTPALSVSSSPSGVTNIYTSTTQQFAAAVVNETNTAVNWLVNNVAGGNSTIGTIDGTGLYSAPATAPSPALITIKAVSQASTTVSASYPVTVVTAPSASQPSPQTISPGSAATYSLSLNENTGNPQQPITLSCVQSTLPPGATCTFSPTTITPSKTASVLFGLTVSVPAGAASLLRPSETQFALMLFPALAPFAGLILLDGKRRIQRSRWLWLVSTLLILLPLGACGGGSSGNSAKQNPETGTYNIQIQGKTAAQPTAVTITTVGLTVQ